MMGMDQVDGKAPRIQDAVALDVPSRDSFAVEAHMHD
jgi:hypothetical protein